MPVRCWHGNQAGRMCVTRHEVRGVWRSAKRVHHEFSHSSIACILV